MQACCSPCPTDVLDRASVSSAQCHLQLSCTSALAAVPEALLRSSCVATKVRAVQSLTGSLRARRRDPEPVVGGAAAGARGALGRVQRAHEAGGGAPPRALQAAGAAPRCQLTLCSLAQPGTLPEFGMMTCILCGAMRFSCCSPCLRPM